VYYNWNIIVDPDNLDFNKEFSDWKEKVTDETTIDFYTIEKKYLTSLQSIYIDTVAKNWAGAE